MKITGFFVFSLLFFSLSVSSVAQVSLGAFGGVNFGKLNGDTPKNGYYVPNGGLNSGLLIDIPVGKAVSLSLQPSFSQEGTKLLFYQGKYQEPIDSIHLRLNYFSLPLMVKVQSTSKHFYAVGGLEAGYLVSYKLTSHGDILSNALSVAGINVAAHFGAGYQIFIGKPVLFFELRYTQGLINLTDEPVDKSYIPRVKTTGFKALIGVTMPLSK